MTYQQKEIFKRLMAAQGQPAKISIGIELVATIPDDGRPHFNNKSLDDIEGEFWVDVPKHEGYYMASTFGRIKSFYRATEGERQILEGSIDSGGYIMVSLSKNGNAKKVRLHNIMGLCFKKKTNPSLDLHHKNGIKIDNRDVNIEYTTRSKNIQHAWDTGLNQGGSFIYGTKRYNAVLTEDKVRQVRIMIRDGKQRKDICKELEIAVHSYKSIRAGAWPHVKI